METSKRISLFGFDGDRQNHLSHLPQVSSKSVYLYKQIDRAYLVFSFVVIFIGLWGKYFKRKKFFQSRTDVSGKRFQMLLIIQGIFKCSCVNREVLEEKFGTFSFLKLL